jgi:hypothetical protein
MILGPVVWADLEPVAPQIRRVVLAPLVELAVVVVVHHPMAVLDHLRRPEVVEMA